MEQMSKKDLQFNIKLYKEIIRNCKTDIKFAEKRIEQYKRKLEKLD